MGEFFDAPVVCNTGRVPRAVVDELVQAPYADRAELERELSGFTVLELTKPPEPLLLAELDLGEASVIAAACADHLKGVLMDERKGRRICESDIWPPRLRAPVVC